MILQPGTNTNYRISSTKEEHLSLIHISKHFLAAVPKTAKTIAVLDRTKEPGANVEPVYLDVKDCFYGAENAPVIVGGRYGLGSKDTTPAQILSAVSYTHLPNWLCFLCGMRNGEVRCWLLLLIISII